MFLQDALTCAEAEAVFGIDRSRREISRCGNQRFGSELQHGDTGLTLRADGKNFATPLTHDMQTVSDELQAHLEQLIGIPHNLGKRGVELHTHFDLESLPLSLRQFNGGARQSV